MRWRPIDAAILAAIPAVSESAGAGPHWDSSSSQWPGYDVDHYDYEITEYTIDVGDDRYVSPCCGYGRIGGNKFGNHVG